MLQRVRNISKRKQGLFASAIGVLGVLVLLIQYGTVPDLVAVPETLEVGADQACVVEQGGTVACWGDLVEISRSGDQSILADEDGALRVEGIVDAVDVATSNVGACALNESGTVQCWSWLDGQDPFMQSLLANGARAEPDSEGSVTVAGLSDVVGIQGGHAFCAFHGDNAVSCTDWAEWSRTGFTQVEVLSGASSLSITANQVCGVMPEATVRCVPRGATHPDDFSTRSDGVRWERSITSRIFGDSGCVGEEGGSTSCWGGSRASTAGLDGAETAFHVRGDICGTVDGAVVCVDVRDGSDSEAVVRTLPGPVNVVHAESNREVACAAQVDGRVLCWGSLFGPGTLGDRGNSIDSDSPVVVAAHSTANRTRRLRLGLFAGLFLLGLWTAFASRDWRQRERAAEPPMAMPV